MMKKVSKIFIRIALGLTSLIIIFSLVLRIPIFEVISCKSEGWYNF